MLSFAMHRLVAISIAVLLLAATQAAAQNSDPFHEAAPPAAVTPGQDPFQMAPADPVPAPKPAPARPRPVREPEPEPVAPPPPPAPPPPAPNAKCFTFNNKQFCE
jgi:colicin import membrane protein